MEVSQQLLIGTHLVLEPHLVLDKQTVIFYSLPAVLKLVLGALCFTVHSSSAQYCVCKALFAVRLVERALEV